MIGKNRPQEKKEDRDSGRIKVNNYFISILYHSRRITVEDYFISILYHYFIIIVICCYTSIKTSKGQMGSAKKHK